MKKRSIQQIFPLIMTHTFLNPVLENLTFDHRIISCHDYINVNKAFRSTCLHSLLQSLQFQMYLIELNKMSLLYRTFVNKFKVK